MLVSVGYSSCHWCHVMEHESFSDQTTAGLMNDLFVNVKVDREERPDVDALTMEACVTMTGQGGWPTTVFLTPEGRPFYAGTYFPPEPRHGLPSFRQVLHAIDGAWRERRDDLEAQAERLVGALGGAARLEAATGRSRRGCSTPQSAAWRATTSRPSAGRRGARVPALVRGRAPAAARGRRGARHGTTHPRRDGGRRPLRRRRRWIPPLLGRRAVGRPALREDAVRQRAARLGVPACLGRDGQGPLPQGRRGDGRLPASRDAAGERRVRLGSGCRHRRRRGADVHVDAGRVGGARARRGAPRAVEHGRSIVRGELDARTTTRLLGLRSDARSRFATTRRSRRGTGSRSPRSPRRLVGSRATTGWPSQSGSAPSCSARYGARTAGCCGASARVASADGASSTTTPTSPTGCSSSMSPRATSAGCSRRGGSRTSRSTSSPTTSAGASSSRRATENRWPRGRRTSTTTRSRRGTR